MAYKPHKTDAKTLEKYCKRLLREDSRGFVFYRRQLTDTEGQPTSIQTLFATSCMALDVTRYADLIPFVPQDTHTYPQCYSYGSRVPKIDYGKSWDIWAAEAQEEAGKILEPLNYFSYAGAIFVRHLAIKDTGGATQQACHIRVDSELLQLLPEAYDYSPDIQLIMQKDARIWVCNTRLKSTIAYLMPLQHVDTKGYTVIHKSCPTCRGDGMPQPVPESVVGACEI